MRKPPDANEHLTPPTSPAQNSLSVASRQPTRVVYRGAAAEHFLQMRRGKHCALKNQSKAGGLARQRLRRAVDGAAQCPLPTHLMVSARGVVLKTRRVELKERRSVSRSGGGRREPLQLRERVSDRSCATGVATAARVADATERLIVAACTPVAAPPPDDGQPWVSLATIGTVDSLLALVAAYRRAAPAAAAGTSRSSSASRLILNAGGSELDAAVTAFVQAAALTIPRFADLLRSIAMGEKTFILLPHFVAPPVGKNDKVAAMALHQDTEKECTMLTVGFSLSGDALGIEIFLGTKSASQWQTRRHSPLTPACCTGAWSCAAAQCTARRL